MTTTASSSSSSSWPMQQEWKLISYSHDGGSDDLLTPALRSPAAKHYLTLLARHHVARPTDLLPSSLAPLQGADPIESLSVAVASLTAFIQLNWTGPELPSSSLQPGSLLRWADPSAFPPRSVDADEDDEPLDRSLNSAALESLTWQGEPAYHLCRHAFFLVFARSIVDGLLAANSALTTLPWWKLRITALHNRILDEPVSLPQDVLRGVDSLLSRANLDPQLRARLLIERGLAISKTGQDKEANELFVQAVGATGLRYELSGALGKKTKFQKEEKTILVVLAESGEETLRADEELRAGSGEEKKGKDASASSQPEPPPMSTGWKPTPAAGQAADMPSNFELNDDTLLEQTDFTSSAPTPVEQSSFTFTSSAPPSARDPSQQPPLAALDQTILLSLSLFLTNTSPEHGLVASQISAFVSRVLQHPRNWSVYTMALLLRSRLEASRTRTAERAVLQLQALVDQMPTTDSSSRERLRFFFQLDLPSKWEMQAELARRYATLGVLRSALEIYERIEMWEDVVACLGSLGRQAEGIEVVRQLLEGGKVEASEVLAAKKSGRAQQQQRDRLTRARKAKLWCLLGDLEPAEAKRHYLTAWRTSAGSSARAARSLGGLYFALTNYTRSALWLRRALRLSALMGRTWFMLGCCYLRREEWGRAARCFRRCTAVDEDDGEAWNNLASCYLRMAGGGDEVTQEELQGDEVDEEGEGSEDDGSEDGDDDDDAASTTSSMATATTADSGMTLDGARPPRAAQEDDPDHSSPRTILTPYILKILSQRCLRHSLKHAPDSWRVWSNYMVVCVDVGDMGEACRAFGQVVRLRAKAEGGRIRDADGEVDWDVLRKLIDVAASEARDAGAEEKVAAAAPASTSTASGNAPAPSYLDLVSAPVSVPTTSATGNNDGSSKARSTSFLLTSLLDLIHTTLPPLLPNPPPAQLPLLSARLYTSQRLYAQAITAYLDAFRSQVPPTAAPCAEREPWARACAAAGEMCENVAAVAGQLGDDEEEKRAKWKAKSLLRGFMAKHKSTWEGEEGWEELVRWRGELEA